MYEMLQELGRCIATILHTRHVITTEVFDEHTDSIEYNDFDIDKTIYDDRFDGVDEYFDTYIQRR